MIVIIIIKTRMLMETNNRNDNGPDYCAVTHFDIQTLINCILLMFQHGNTFYLAEWRSNLGLIPVHVSTPGFTASFKIETWNLFPLLAERMNFYVNCTLHVFLAVTVGTNVKNIIVCIFIN